jgi:hypothetical protein
MLLLIALAAAVSGCTVKMGTLRPGPASAIDGKAISLADARSLHYVRDEWMRFDFDSDMDYARLIRRRELNVYVRVRWCGNELQGRELTIARLFGEDGRVGASSRLLPEPSTQPGSPVAFRYHTYVPVRVPKGPVMPPGSPDQGGDYDLRHPADDLCLSVGGGDMFGNHGESTLAVYHRYFLQVALDTFGTKP